MSNRDPVHWTACGAAIRVPRRRSDVVLEELDGEAVVIDGRRGNMHRLNETALFVWRACDGQATTRHIAQHLTQAYDVGFAAALASVDQLMVRFAALHLFEELPATEPQPCLTEPRP